MLRVRCTQKLVSIRKRYVIDQILKLRRILRVQDCHLTVHLASNTLVQKMNRLDRGVDRPTDVLSYPAQELKPGERPEPNEDGEKELGHIVLGMGYLRNASASNEMSLEEYLPTVLSHGMIHLLGYDHQTDQEYNHMMAKERRTLKRLKELNTLEPPPHDEEPTNKPFTWTEARQRLRSHKQKD